MPQPIHGNHSLETIGVISLKEFRIIPHRSIYHLLSVLFLILFFFLGALPTSIAAGQVLLLSTAPDRSNPVALANSKVQGDAYVFISPENGISQVRFFLDDANMAKSPIQIESYAPYDLAGGSKSLANPFDSTQLTDGTHTITAKIISDSGTTAVISANFTVANSVASSPEPQLLLSTNPDRSNPVALASASVASNIFVFVSPENGISQVRFFLDDANMTKSPIQIESYAPYDLAGGSKSLANPFDSTQLTDGTHTITAQIIFNANITSVINASFMVDNQNDTPLAVHDTVTTDENTPITIDVLANDKGLSDKPITLSIISKPSKGTVSLKDDNTIAYKPTAPGEDAFMYKLTDANGDNSITDVTININCTNCVGTVKLILNWNPNPTEVLGYSIYYGTPESDKRHLSDLYIKSNDINPLAPSITYTAADLNVIIGNTVCFWVQAFNTVGESDPSEPICKIISNS